MTPNQTPRSELRTQNAPRIFLFVRARRILAALSLVMLAFVGAASALPGVPAVPALPGAPALPALPDVPATPALPAVEQGVDTPLGSSSLSAADGKVDVCNSYAANTDMLPAAPALPVQAPALPVQAPALPTASGGAALDACAHADANALTASATAGAHATAMDQAAGLKAGADASQAGTAGDIEAHTGFLDAIVSWFQGLF